MLRHLNIGGETRPVNFGFNALAEASQHLAVDWVLDITTGLSFVQLRALYWAALKDGARIEGKEFSFTPENVADWISEDMRTMALLREWFDYDVLMAGKKKENQEAETKPTPKAKAAKSGGSTNTKP